MNARALRDTLIARLATERGLPLPIQGRDRVALVYPSPYRAGMSSLGYQRIATLLADAGYTVERFFLPDDVDAWRKARLPPLSMETRSPLQGFPLLAVSLAYELELPGLLTMLDLAGIPLLREERRARDPQVLLGGPLTFSNPLPAGPFVDAMLLGEAEDTVVPAVDGYFADGHLRAVARLAGGYVPELHGESLPPVARADDARLPARSRLWSPDMELHDMFLVEGERGCHRACTFCVMRRSTNGGMRLVTPDALLALVPTEAPRVGLVGAAVSDHPGLVELLRALVDAGKGVGISSLRADRVALKPEIPRLLRAGGSRTLTVASDAASQRLRRTLQKGTTEAHLVACAEAAHEHRYNVLKVYMMVGVPDEQDEDIDELVAFSRRLAAIHPLALGIAPFVPKRNTPLDTAPFAGIRAVDRRLDRIRDGLKTAGVDVRPTSARWAWVEYRLAQAGWDGGVATMAAWRAGGSFAAWKAAFRAEEARAPWRDQALPAE